MPRDRTALHLCRGNWTPDDAVALHGDYAPLVDVLRAVPVTDAGDLDLEAFGRLLTDRTRIFAVVQLSNVLGTINPVRELAARARAAGAVTRNSRQPPTRTSSIEFAVG